MLLVCDSSGTKRLLTAAQHPNLCHPASFHRCPFGVRHLLSELRCYALTEILIHPVIPGRVASLHNGCKHRLLEGLSVTNPRPRVRVATQYNARKVGMTFQPVHIELSLSLRTSLILRVAMLRSSSVDVVPHSAYSLGPLVSSMCMYLCLQIH